LSEVELTLAVYLLFVVTPAELASEHLPEEVAKLQLLVETLEEVLQSKIQKSVPEEEDEENLCAICYYHPNDTVFVPCGHQSCKMYAIIPISHTVLFVY
jgi:hypothetical protein